MPIHGWDEGSREWQRLGKIRLGYMVEKDGKQYPTSSNQFEMDDELKRKLAKVMPATKNGITELDVMFPAESVEKIIPSHLKRYNGKNKLICKGDGKIARVTKEHLDYVFGNNKQPEYVKRDQNGKYVYADGKPVKTEYVSGQECVIIPCSYKRCPFYNRSYCKEVATLNVVLYKLPELGVYSIETSSYNTYQNVKNSINMIKNAVGHVSFVPLKLKIKMEAKGDYKKKFPILYVDTAGMTLEELINKYGNKEPQAEPQFEPEDDANKPELLYGPRKKQTNQKPNGQQNTSQGKPQNQNQQQPPQNSQTKTQEKDMGLFEVLAAKKTQDSSNKPLLKLALKQIGGEQPGRQITAFTYRQADEKELLGKKIVPEIHFQDGNNGKKVSIIAKWTVVA